MSASPSPRGLDATHDRDRRSWVAGTDDPQTDFPIQNLPLGTFRRAEDESSRIGIAIGERILDLAAAVEKGLLDGLAGELACAACAPVLNDLMRLGPEHWRALRQRASELLSEEENRQRTEPALLDPRDVEMVLPARIGDYTDFYASVYHATNVGRLFRPDDPLLPNYKWVPIGYHGRASSVVASGTEIRRPAGQRKAPDAAEPSYGPCRLLDYELEVGFFVGPGNALGETLPVGEAERHVFGLCLVNDWSARDLQAWEYQPLGPFLAKSFATTVSPWVVTLEALAPFRGPAFQRPEGDPRPLPYLDQGEQEGSAGIDLRVEVLLETAKMREQGSAPAKLSEGSFLDMYWSVAQMVAHHSSNGCNLQPGDLMASGTVSGPEPGNLGCLLEITQRGQKPLELPNGERRTFLEDGDEVILRGRCEREGYRRIGFGECRGRVVG